MTEQVILGIDIGGTNTKLGLVDRNGRALSSMSISTHATEDVSFFSSYLQVAIQKLQEDVVVPFTLCGTGIGAPNANFHSGCIEQAPNLYWGDVVPIADIVSNITGVPTWITNDANAAAIGEMKFGVARGLKSFVVLTLGTGLGSGIVIDGELIYGHDGFAGEVGHVTLRQGGRSHTTGRLGSAETYISATGLERTAFELLGQNHAASKLRTKSMVQADAHYLYKLARKGDEIALRAFNITGELLAEVIADSLALLDIEAVILFGGLANAKGLLLDPMHMKLQELLSAEEYQQLRVLISDMKGDNSAILGAAALAWQVLSATETGALTPE